ncbi:MAG: phage terminase large subunit [Candidatus Tokpelaia sp. JSC085]|nr:MAG: phage terminase large subunit [Candidatus Tokpelaia sp. JSC085]
MEATITIQLSEKIVEVFSGKAKYRCAYGGRGSGKSFSFAKMAAIRGYQLAREGKKGLIVCARQFMSSLNESSMSEIKRAIADEKFLSSNYDVGEKFIRTAKSKWVQGKIEFDFVGIQRNLDSIKSKSQIHILWIDEAETVTETAWDKIIPTVREEHSEIWVTWNPERKKSATHIRFRENTPNNCKIVQVNWKDNPWFPHSLEESRIEDLNKRPEQYAHVWEGDFVTAYAGAYFTQYIHSARKEGRIGNISADPLIKIQAFWDIGGTGAQADATAIWICQLIGREIRVLNYYEAQGQPLSEHVNWLRDKGYDHAYMVLPHDGAAGDKVYSTSYEAALRSAGFKVTVIKNQGTGAAAQRIEAIRRIFPSIWFNEQTTKAGLEALGAYHEKRDEHRGIGLGPAHDWSSHSADAFGLMAITYSEPQEQKDRKRYMYQQYGTGKGSWLSR